MSNAAHLAWLTYCTTELNTLTPLLTRLGYTLLTEQPHLSGERYLMQAVTTTSGRKLILFGVTSAGQRVIIKATSDKAGKAELTHERNCRLFLSQIDFAASIFHTPPEIGFHEVGGVTISVQAYIPQTVSFLERPLEEQFFFALNAFKAQEGAHAATYKHRAKIKRIYGIKDAATYLRTFAEFKNYLTLQHGENEVLAKRLAEVETELTTNQHHLEQYSGFLTHTDFVPHNFRIDTTGTMYLLDFSSLVFGNKYEGWARFINFMELYNPPLAAALVAYVTDNRSAEEASSLYLMRLYRLTELIRYYTGTLAQSDGDVLLLNRTRVHFWTDVLTAVSQHTTVDASILESYKTTRDTLRSDAEKKRQIGLH